MTHEGKGPVELQLALLEVALEFSGRPMTTRLRERFVEKLLRCYLSQAPRAERGNLPTDTRALPSGAPPGRATARAPLPQRGSDGLAGAGTGSSRRRAGARRGRLPGIRPAPGRAH